MPSRRRPRATGLASQAAELGLAVPEVVARRLARLALAGPSPSAEDWHEFHRMSAEKVSAFYESWNGMFLAAWRANSQLLWSAPAWSANWASPHRRVVHKQVQRMTLDILASGIAPIHRRAVANARRLRKRGT